MLPLAVMVVLAFGFFPTVSNFVAAESPGRYQFITEFTVPTEQSGPFAITTTPEGEVWFTEDKASKIGVFFSNNSTFKEYTIPFYGQNLWGIAVDRQRNVWFTGWDTNSIGKLDVATGNFTQFKLPTLNSKPTKILVDKKGLVWFTEWAASKVGRLDPKTGEIKEIETPIQRNGLGAGPVGITLANDGKLWFAESIGQKIAYFDPEREQFEEFTPQVQVASPVGIAIDEEGVVYFTDHGGNEIIRYDPNSNRWDKIPTSPSPPDFFPTSLPTGLDIDKNGNVWTAEHGGNKIGKYDSKQEVLTEYWIPDAASITLWVAVDLNGKAWFAEAAANKIGYVNPNAVPSFSIDAKPRQLILAKPDNTAESTISLTSSSTSPQNLLINLTGPSFPNPDFSGITIEPKMLNLPAYTLATVSFRISADSNTKPGNYAFTLSATDKTVSQGKIIRIDVGEESTQKATGNQTPSLPAAPTSPFPLTTKLPIIPEPTKEEPTTPQAPSQISTPEIPLSTTTPTIRNQESDSNSPFIFITLGIIAAAIAFGLILRTVRGKNR